MTNFFGIILIALIVTVDNALLAGLLLPMTSKETKRFILVIIGTLLGISQILLAASVDQMLHNIFFRIAGIILLGWMSIRTMGLQATRGFQSWTLSIKLWLFTVVGNLDNMFWLGSELKGDRLWLIFSSIGTIPIFVAVALFLSEQCEKQQWILHVGAGMMAWAAASLTLDIPAIKTWVNGIDEAPVTTFQCLITVFILAIGLGIRQLMLQRNDKL